MKTIVLVAQMLGIYMTVSGLFLVLRGKTVPHLLKDFFGHPAVVHLTGAILIFLSSMYLLQYNIWDGTWRTVITFFVWLVLFKGLVYTFIPRVFSEMFIAKQRKAFGIYGVIAIAVGVYLFLLG